MSLVAKLWRDESGVVLSAELVLILTIAVLAVIVGLSEVTVAVNTELNDVSNAIGALNQTYRFTGYRSSGGYNDKLKSSFAGSSYTDGIDDGDFNGSCDIVAGASSCDGEPRY